MCTQIEEYEKTLESTPLFTIYPERKSRREQSKLVLLTKIANLLENLIDIECEQNQTNSENSFDVDYVPSISIIEYLKRVDLYLKFDEDFYYTALIYIDRFIEKKKFHLSYSNVYNIIISSLIVSSKFYHDEMYNNAVFAKIAGVSNSELNFLEMEFYKCIEFNLFIDSMAFTNYITKFNEYF